MAASTKCAAGGAGSSKAQCGAQDATEDSLRLYRTMLLIRHFEESVRRLAAAGETPGLVHLCSGQEATNVGVVLALREGDYIASHHRGHGHCIAKGAPIDLLLAEILGKAPGICGGRSGSMHVVDLPRGNLGTNGIVGGGIPLAAGAALAARARGTGEVAVCFFGDGALNQGLLHECMNMAAIWNLPVIFVCENNGYGEFTAMEDVTAGPSVNARGEVFGIPSIAVDGMNVRAVRSATLAAAARARVGEGPSFLVCNTWRYGGHHAGDKQDYKDNDETKRWEALDPLITFAHTLMAEKRASRDDLAAIEAEVVGQVKAAVAFARAAPQPALEALEAHVHG